MHAETLKGKGKIQIDFLGLGMNLPIFFDK